MSPLNFTINGSSVLVTFFNSKIYLSKFFPLISSTISLSPSLSVQLPNNKAGTSIFKSSHTHLGLEKLPSNNSLFKIGNI